MRISDWSSDVCSSDLAAWRDPRIAINRIGVRLEHVHRKSDMRQEPGMVAVRPDRIDGARGKRLQHQPPGFLLNLRLALHFCRKLGRRSEERRVGKECVVRVEIGGCRVNKKKSI